MARNKRNQSYGIPFGRFPFVGTVSKSVSFVGREAQRAKLTRRLVDARQRTSVLITGRRGTGKTTFVEHCLEEYDLSLFRRFLRADNGRSIADLVVVMAVVAVFATLLLAVADGIQLLSPVALEQPLVLIPLLFLTLLAVAPILIAWRILRSTFRVRISQKWVSLVTALFVFAVLFLSSLSSIYPDGNFQRSTDLIELSFMPVAAPTLSISRLILAISLLGFLGEFIQPGYSVFSFSRVRTYLRVSFWPAAGLFIKWIFTLSTRLFLPICAVIFGSLVGPINSINEFSFWLLEMCQEVICAAPENGAAKDKSLGLPLAFVGGISQASAADEVANNFALSILCLMLLFTTKSVRAYGESRSDSFLQGLYGFRAPNSKGFLGMEQDQDEGLPRRLYRLFFQAHNRLRREFLNKSFIHLFSLIIVGILFSQFENTTKILQRNLGFEVSVEQTQFLLLFLVVSFGIAVLLVIGRGIANGARQSESPWVQALVCRTEGVAHPIVEFALFKACALIFVALHLGYGIAGVVLDPAELETKRNLEEKYFDPGAQVSEDLIKPEIIATIEQQCKGLDTSRDGQSKPNSDKGMPKKEINISVDLAWVLKMAGHNSFSESETRQKDMPKLDVDCVDLEKGFLYRQSNEGTVSIKPTPIRGISSIKPGTEPPVSAHIIIKKMASDGTKQDLVYEAALPRTFTLFSGPKEEFGWILHVVLILFLIFFLDYEWINRPTTSLSDSRAIEPGTRRRWRPKLFYDAASHVVPIGWFSKRLRNASPIDRSEYEKMERYRRRNAGMIERTTLPYYLALFWMKSIVVRVNLGFDQLEHRGVILAMLTGLRDQYRSLFSGHKSLHSVVSAALLLIFVMAFVTSLGNQLFSIPEIKKEGISTAKPFIRSASDSDVSNHLIRNGQVPKISYCALIKDYYEGRSSKSLSEVQAALVPRVMCEVSPNFTNAVLPIIYAPLLAIDIPTKNVLDRFVFRVMHKNSGLPYFSDTCFSPPSAGAGCTGEVVIENREGTSLRVYHVVLFGVFLFLWLKIYRLMALTPYHRIIRRFDSLIDLLVTSGSESTRRGLGASTNFFGRLFFDRTTEVNRQPLDPRAVEAMLFKILTDMQSSKLNVPFSHAFSVTIPTPEVTFVFDELDKVTGLPASQSSGGPAMDEIAALDAERRRTYALRELLSDMKRIISSAPARFIFVGNRLLHDEWIADHTRRTPLLTSIFDEEVYLPSLLVDKGSVLAPASQKHSHNIQDRIWEYISRLHDEAQRNFMSSSRVRLAPFYGRIPHQLGIATSYADDYVDVRQQRGGARYEFGDMDDTRLRYQVAQRYGPYFDVFLPVFICDDGRSIDNVYNNDAINNRDESWRRHFVSDFVNFITFRSLGNPKKMQQLISEFVEQSARVAPPPDKFMLLDPLESKELNPRDNVFVTDDVLFFPPDQVFRVQLVGSFLRNVIDSFHGDIGRQDDRLIVSVIYLFEFLFKFHGRGFSWSSLERVEELAHIHKSPEVRKIMTTLVNAISERYLHRILNGMYGFRFRSDLAIDLRRVSRKFEIEQAAFNFTLDESETLKASYIVQLAQSETTNLDIIAALGELYELDQEFETARHHYRHAVRLNDEYFFYYNGREVEQNDPLIERAKKLSTQYLDPNDPVTADYITKRWTAAIVSDSSPTNISTLQGVMSRDLGARKLVQSYAPWGARRLRLMLKVGLTYELTLDMEMAELHYRDAKRLAFSLIDSFIRWKETDEAGNPVREYDVQILKNVPLFYQPIFAEAWVSQKIQSGIDSSLTVVEEGLAELRMKLSFLNDPSITYDRTELKNPHENFFERVHHVGKSSQFAMIGAELHNKAGDLYYFKGRSFVELEGLNDIVNDRGNADGFLLIAHKHYAIALHELRRYIVFRQATSSWRLHISDPATVAPEGNKATISSGDWPDFVGLAVVNNLTDLADAAFSRTSLIKLVSELAGDSADPDGLLCGDPKEDNRDFQHSIKKFLESDDRKISSKFNVRWQQSKHDRMISQILGKWNPNGDPQSPEWTSTHQIISFAKPSSSLHRLYVGFHLGTSAAAITEKSGYPINAASEFLYAADIASVYLLRLRMLNYLKLLADHKVDSGKESQNEWKQVSGLLSCLSQTENNQCCLNQKQIEFGIYLLKTLVFNLRRYNDLSCREASKQNEDYRVGTVIEPGAVTTLCAGILHASGLFTHILDSDSNGTDSTVVKRCLDDLVDILKHWQSESFEAAQRSGIESFYPDSLTASADSFETTVNRMSVAESYGLIARAALNYSLVRHIYPSLNQINGLRVLIEDACLSTPTNEECNRDTRRWTRNKSKTVNKYLRNMRSLGDELESPMHVTALNTGISAMLFWLRSRHSRLVDKRLSFLNDEHLLRISNTRSDNITKINESLRQCALKLIDLNSFLSDKALNSNAQITRLRKLVSSVSNWVGCMQDFLSVNEKPNNDVFHYQLSQAIDHILAAISSERLVGELAKSLKSTPELARRPQALAFNQSINLLQYTCNHVVDSFLHDETVTRAHIQKEVRVFREHCEFARRLAQKSLRESRETYTMGPKFRTSIANLHYLFDDFNDRRLHVNHSLQMSGMELCSLLEYLNVALDSEISDDGSLH